MVLLNYVEVAGMATLTSDQVQGLDPYAFFVDERGHAPAGMTCAISRPAYLRKMAWLLPRMSRAIPYPGYVLVCAHKPDAPTEAP